MICAWPLDQGRVTSHSQVDPFLYKIFNDNIFKSHVLCKINNNFFWSRLRLSTIRYDNYRTYIINNCDYRTYMPFFGLGVWNHVR
jgi:hypothetical protein